MCTQNYLEYITRTNKTIRSNEKDDIWPADNIQSTEIILTELLRLKQFQKRSLSGTSFIVNSITVEKNLLTFALLPTFGYVFSVDRRTQRVSGRDGFESLRSLHFLRILFCNCFNFFSLLCIKLSIHGISSLPFPTKGEPWHRRCSKMSLPDQRT